MAPAAIAVMQAAILFVAGFAIQDDAAHGRAFMRVEDFLDGPDSGVVSGEVAGASEAFVEVSAEDSTIHEGEDGGASVDDAGGRGKSRSSLTNADRPDWAGRGRGPDGNGPPGQRGRGRGKGGNGPPGQRGRGRGPDGNGPPGQRRRGPDENGPSGQGGSGRGKHSSQESPAGDQKKTKITIVTKAEKSRSTLAKTTSLATTTTQATATPSGPGVLGGFDLPSFNPMDIFRRTTTSKGRVAESSPVTTTTSLSSAPATTTTALAPSPPSTTTTLPSAASASSTPGGFHLPSFNPMDVFRRTTTTSLTSAPGTTTALAPSPPSTTTTFPPAASASTTPPQTSSAAPSTTTTATSTALTYGTSGPGSTPPAGLPSPVLEPTVPPTQLEAKADVTVQKTTTTTLPEHVSAVTPEPAAASPPPAPQAGSTTLPTAAQGAKTGTMVVQAFQADNCEGMAISSLRFDYLPDFKECGACFPSNSGEAIRVCDKGGVLHADIYQASACEVPMLSGDIDAVKECVQIKDTAVSLSVTGTGDFRLEEMEFCKCAAAAI